MMEKKECVFRYEYLKDDAQGNIHEMFSCSWCGTLWADPEGFVICPECGAKITGWFE